MSENKESVASYEEALAWSVTWIKDWEKGINNGTPVGWNWHKVIPIGRWRMESETPFTDMITELRWAGAVDKNKAVTAEEKAALVDFGAVADEEFTGHSDLKKYVFKVKLVKEGEDYKALSVVGISIENILNIIFHADYEGWVVVSVVRGSIIDIC